MRTVRERSKSHPTCEQLPNFPFFFPGTLDRQGLAPTQCHQRIWHSLMRDQPTPFYRRRWPSNVLHHRAVRRCLIPQRSIFRAHAMSGCHLKSGTTRLTYPEGCTYHDRNSASAPSEIRSRVRRRANDASERHGPVRFRSHSKSAAGRPAGAGCRVTRVTACQLQLHC
jgi:hypothetical protein